MTVLVRSAIGFALVLLVFVAQTDPGEGSHRQPLKVYPVIFYGSNQTYDSEWPDRALRQVEQVRAWYKSAHPDGRTFQIGEISSYQGRYSWQWYMEAISPWGAIREDVRYLSGHHLKPDPIGSQTQGLYAGYIHMIFPAFLGPYVGDGISTARGGAIDAGVAWVSDELSERSERPSDCCRWAGSLGGQAHEMAHALNIEDHLSCAPCLTDFGNFPEITLVTQQVGWLDQHSLLQANIGSIPPAPSDVHLPNTGGTSWIDVCYQDNAPNEEQYYLQLEQQSSGPARRIQLYNQPAWPGVGEACQAGVGWYSQTQGEYANYNAMIYAQGTGGNSAKVANNLPWWFSRPMKPRPAAPTGVVAQASNASTGRIDVCFYDMSNNEDGFMIELEWEPSGQESAVPPHGGRTVWRSFEPAQSQPAPTWTCTEAYAAYGGRYRAEVFAIVQGATSSTANPAANASNQPVASLSNVEEYNKDADGDGWLDANRVVPNPDNCADWPNPGQTLPPWPVPTANPQQHPNWIWSVDRDCDGFSAEAELFTGTNALAHCSATPALNDEAVDAWPSDFNDDQRTNLSDLGLIGPHYNTVRGVHPAYNARFDLNSDDRVNLSDVGLLGGFFNLSCT